jgi:three-Cys-motif partner protein
MANPLMPQLKLTLVDGFAGGGSFIDECGETFGSPLLLLQTVKEAIVHLNVTRTKTQRNVDTRFHFVEINPSNFEYLRHLLKSEGYSSQFGEKIFLHQKAFEEVCKDIVTHTRGHKGGERALFLLDQYAYDDISFPTVRYIMSSLKGAEVILTFNVDSLLTFLTDSKEFHQITERIGLREHIDWDGYKALKAQTRWREMIQRQIAYGIWRATGAKFMTLFFVTPQGHRPWSYWLVHLSNVYKANDVMKGVHWQHGNSFGHSLEPGLFQIGYQANQDEGVTGQMGLSFQEPAAFDDLLKDASIKRLGELLPEMIKEHPEGISFMTLLESIANRTNANSELIRQSLDIALQTRDIRVEKSGGGQRTKGSAIGASDILIPSNQRSLFLPF